MMAGRSMSGSDLETEPVEEEMKDQGVEDALDRKQRVMRDRMKVAFC